MQMTFLLDADYDTVICKCIQVFHIFVAAADFSALNRDFITQCSTPLGLIITGSKGMLTSHIYISNKSLLCYCIQYFAQQYFVVLAAATSQPALDV